MIKQWVDISSDYKDAAIILGNGASIAFSENFSYSNLYEVSKTKNFINDELEILFKKFETKNFEVVLYRLWQTMEVINLFEQFKENVFIIKEKYSNCRKALIATVNATHIKYNKRNLEFVKKLENASNFLKNFKSIYSLNYDLLLYWVIEMGNRNGSIFKDCFCEGTTKKTNYRTFKNDWGFLKTPYNNQEKAILVFYPHGNLTLARIKNKQLNEIDIKITSHDESHLDEIIKKWNDELNPYEPLFISEGECNEKKNRIYESKYLSNVFEKGFEEIEQNLVLYGWSMSAEDKHILDRIARIQKERKSKNNDVEKKPISRVAVSVYPDGNETTFEKEVKDKLISITTEVDFFYSNNGCWCF